MYIYCQDNIHGACSWRKQLRLSHNAWWEQSNKGRRKKAKIIYLNTLNKQKNSFKIASNKESTLRPLTMNTNYRLMGPEAKSSSTLFSAPELLTIAPPLLDFEDELLWLDFTNPQIHKPIYDKKIDFINCTAKSLMEQAYIQPISIADQQILIEEMGKNSNFINHIGLTPAKLPQLVENNPLISFELLYRLVDTEEITEFYNVLVHMDITLHSMEVVNRLTTTVVLPIEFIHLYISNCISSCETVKDKYMQSRLVRLVCVFLQSLIRNKMVNVKELFIEIEAFCVGFSQIKEAAGLYRLLKHLEMGEPVTAGNNGAGNNNGTGPAAGSQTNSTLNKQEIGSAGNSPTKSNN